MLCSLIELAPNFSTNLRVVREFFNKLNAARKCLQNEDNLQDRNTEPELSQISSKCVERMQEGCFTIQSFNYNSTVLQNRLKRGHICASWFANVRRFNAAAFNLSKETGLPLHRVKYVRSYLHTKVDFTGHHWTTLDEKKS